MLSSGRFSGFFIAVLFPTSTVIEKGTRRLFP
jgi:hypothetical protein